MTSVEGSKPSISVRIWFNVCSRSSPPPPPTWPADRDRLLAIVRGADMSDAEIASAREILERTGAHEYTRQQARRYRDQAVAELERAGVVDGSAAERLRDIVVSAIRA